MLTPKTVFGCDFFFFPDENSVAISSFLQNCKSAIAAYFSLGKRINWMFF